MKILFTIIVSVLITVGAWAQSPDKISYQTVLRDSKGDFVSNKTVRMQISILQTSDSGTAVYEETQTPLTNANGLISLEIGTGTVIYGDFSAIDWSKASYFIKTETDLTGGSSYTITGSSQLLSVPYALHANTAESITGSITETDQIFINSIASKITANDTAYWNKHTIDTDTHLDSIDIVNMGYVTGDGTNSGNTPQGTHYLGELFGGGIVFYVYNNGNHGLIASLNDLDGEKGLLYGFETTAIAANSQVDGAANTAAIIAAGGKPEEAAGVCNAYTSEGFNDWYLPANRELSLLASQDILIDLILNNDENPESIGFTRQGEAPRMSYYLSSTEETNERMFGYDFSSSYGHAITLYKTREMRVRAIRAF